MTVSVMGVAAGAIIVEWNIREPHGKKAGAAMWDSHIRCVVNLLVPGPNGLNKGMIDLREVS